MKIIWGWIQLPFLRIDKFIFNDKFEDEFYWTWGFNTYLDIEEIK